MRTGSSAAASHPRTRALWAAAALATVSAALHAFVWTDPTVDALMAGDAAAEARQGLRMMWHGMSAIAWTVPVVLLLLRNRPAAVTRPVLGCVALLSGSQAVLYAVAGVQVHGVSGPLSVPEWALHASIAALAWTARPARPADGPERPARPGRGRLVLLWVALIDAVLNAAFHTVAGTLQSWPEALRTSDTDSGPKLTLYVMWLFSCVLFCAVPAAMVWSRRASAAAGRFLLRYLAVLVAILGVAWGGAIALGHGDDLPPIGAASLGVQALLAALSAPPKTGRRSAPDRKG